MIKAPLAFRPSHRRGAAILGTAAVLVLVVLAARGFDDPGEVEVIRLTEANFAEFAPAGKEADAIIGDVVLRNALITAVIAQPTETRNANMTVRQVAGALIDLTLRENPNDQLGAFYPGARRFPFRTLRVQDQRENTISLEKEPRVVVEGAASVIVTAAATADRPEAQVIYTLEPDEPFVTVRTIYTNRSQDPIDIESVDDLRMDGGNELMMKSPNGTSTSAWAYDRHWGQAVGIETLDVPMQINSDARLTTLKYQLDGGDLFRLMPGDSKALVRWIMPGRNQLDLRAAALDLRGNDLASITLTVAGKHGPIPDADVDLATSTGATWGSGRTDSQGQLSCLLPLGAYTASVTALGQKIAEKLPFTVDGRKDQAELRVEQYAPGTVQAEIVDAVGAPIPCKVEFKPREGTPLPDFGPPSAEFFVKNLCYTADGTFTRTLPAGEYEVTISHGPEYDVVQIGLTVPPGETVPLKARLTRSVDTAGWVSSDFHSHSTPSGDNTASQLGRVLNLLAEHIEFAPCTEHNRIDTYVPHIGRLKAERFMATVSGMELTGGPLPLNHQNAFPLVMRPHRQDGGGPLTDPDPAVQIERLSRWDNQSEKLIQVNHPDLGWMFYDADGDGTPDAGYERMFPWINVIEVHPVDNAWNLTPRMKRGNTEYANTFFGWLQLLNQGYRLPGVVNTDAHYNHHGSGWLRIWIQSSTDEPSMIRVDEMVQAAREGRIIMSNGPFLTVWANEAGKAARVTAGQDLAAPSGKVELSIRVQAPNWIDVDRVRVLQNGRLDPAFEFTRARHPERFARQGAEQFRAKLALDLAADTHLIVMAGNDAADLKTVYGEQWGQQKPTAVSNPIYVDVNSGGFTANKDTLGHPLPVKSR